MDHRLKRRLYLFVLLVGVAVASVYDPYIVLGIAGFFLFGFIALALPIGVWSWWRDRGQPTWLYRLDIDEVGIKYALFHTGEKRIAWSDVSKVVYYHGEPDFPDPNVGMAPLRQWEFYSDTGRSLDIEDVGDRGQRLARWCSKKLAGFDGPAADERLSSTLEGRWLLWERQKS